MDVLEEGAEVIRRAEAELRGLLSRAAERAEYAHVQVLAGWASRLRSLLDGTGNGGVASEELPPRDHAPASDGGALASVSTPAADAGPGKRGGQQTGRRKSRKAARSRKRSSPQAAYPKFLRTGENLVKIGWSKSDKTTYEHKAPRRVVNLLVEALLRVGQGGRRFTSDDLLPLRDTKEGTEIPSYQTYLSLAWLRAEELVVQHGRQGYSLPPSVDLARATEERWQELPQR
jgi:hypothetical protein